MPARSTAPTTPDDVRAWRDRLGLTQQQAAVRIGSSRDRVMKFETEGAPVPLTTALAMAAVEAGLKPLGNRDEKED